MKFCRSCLNTDSRPGTTFNVDGLCPVCSYNNDIVHDWNERKQILSQIVEKAKRDKRGNYDCIIGVSGGKDSTRQAQFVRDVLNMNPLLVCMSYPPEQVTLMGIQNLENLMNLGFDVITIKPSPKVWKKIVKLGFYKYGNYLKGCELALFSSVPRLAIAYQIPLIWWGENSAIQVGENSVKGETDYDGNNLRNMNTLSGGDIQWLLDEGLKKTDILQFTYPSESDLEKADIKITFLGYFWKNWSSIDNAVFSGLHGLEYRANKPWETGDLYGITALDEDWVTFNQGIKYLKFGFGRIHDYVNEEIWQGALTREEGIEIVKKYDGSFSERYVESFCEYIDITKAEFWEVVDRYVNTNLFTKIETGVYQRIFSYE